MSWADRVKAKAPIKKIEILDSEIPKSKVDDSSIIPSTHDGLENLTRQSNPNPRESPNPNPRESPDPIPYSNWEMRDHGDSALIWESNLIFKELDSKSHSLLQKTKKETFDFVTTLDKKNETEKKEEMMALVVRNLVLDCKLDLF